MAAYKRKSFAEKKQEIDQLADDRNKQVENYFRSPEDLKEYLSFMSKFHNYSVRNSTLIQKQFQGANAVGSYAFWKKEGLQVQKGEKGISILVPAPFKTFERKAGETTKTVNVNQATAAEKAAIKRGEMKTKERMAYTKGNVFDISQTNATADDLPKVFPNKWLDGKVDNYENMFASLQRLGEDMGVETMPEPMRELGAAKGAYVEFTRQDHEGNMVKGRGIELNPRNSELQNVKTMIHELAHADLHHSGSKGKDRSHPEKEFQAEMTAYTVASYFNLDTSDYSLQYLKSYTDQEHDIQDKFTLLEEVKGTSNKFIEHLENDLEPVRDNIQVRASDKDVQERFGDFSIITREGFTKIGDMDTETFADTFRAKDGRNILADKEYQTGTALEGIQAFNQNTNQYPESWNGENDNVKILDPSQSETQFFILHSEKPVAQHMMNGEEMDKYLASENLDTLKSIEPFYDKTRVIAVEHTGGDAYNVKNLDRIDLGDGDYHDLRSHTARVGEVPKGIPESNDHLEHVYSKATISKALEGLYTESYYMEHSSISQDASLERAAYSINRMEQFALDHEYLKPEEIKTVKQQAHETAADYKDEMTSRNVLVNLTGDFTNVQKQKLDEKQNGVTEEKLLNRMEVENRYANMKHNALENKLVQPVVIQNMESSILRKFENKEPEKEAPEKAKPNDAIQTTKTDSPYPDTSKQRSAGMSM
ncbi:ImmA/IrrE family metallo-endopeptidase [Alkalicoccus luteus]|uniref:ImmA/IrrE family metallo-endopeptidase n=1 Tax=Alkalicoccus luteus TaxID=1237094 RepID=A0A969TWE8_9BACI|nr:ImmA/IrrE family metallo-endopeptidase [Alkalicoccus luteus]NJP38991.1 ImmA/IrrE family metallo-endopeptidase [Alkalicoccus luteus]